MKFALDSEVNGKFCKLCLENICNIFLNMCSAQASVRAKVNNSSQIGLGYQQKLMKVEIIFVQAQSSLVKISL